MPCETIHTPLTLTFRYITTTSSLGDLHLKLEVHFPCRATFLHTQPELHMNGTDQIHISEWLNESSSQISMENVWQDLKIVVHRCSEVEILLQRVPRIQLSDIH